MRSRLGFVWLSFSFSFAFRSEAVVFFDIPEKERERNDGERGKVKLGKKVKCNPKLVVSRCDMKR